MDKKKIKSIIVFGCFLILFVTLTIVLWPFISSLSTDVGKENLKEKISSLGVVGWFVMVGIQVLQIIVAFLPGEPIEIIMGVFYGSIGGLFTCLLGILIGSILVYLLSKYIGKPFVKLFIDIDDLEKYKFLRNTKKVELTVFILFFIPGTPKDALTYLAPFVPIKPKKFFVISTIARIPSVITSTFLGDQIIKGNYLIAIIVFIITAIISVAGILFSNYYTKRKQNELNK